MKMENNKKSAGTIALVVILLVVTVVSLILATFAWAKYTTTENTSASATVAKWSVAATGGASRHIAQYSFVVADKLAPGTEGKIPVTISAAGSEVDVKYEVYLTSVETKPTNLKFYHSDSTGAVDKTAAYGAGATSIATDSKIAEGTITVENNATNVQQYIYWEWPYETTGGDAIDTQEGQAAQKMTVSYKVVFTQVPPTHN